MEEMMKVELLKGPTVQGVYMNSNKIITLDVDTATQFVMEEGGIIEKENVVHLKSEEELKREALKRDRYSCQFCGERAHMIQRIIPRKNGGLLTLKNLQSVCKKCSQHSKKHNIYDARFDYKLQLNRIPECLTGKEVSVISIVPYYERKVSFEIAVSLVKEEAAYFKSGEKDTLYLLFNDKTLKQHVLKRDQYRCYSCKEEANSIERIIEKKDNGLRSPKNMRTVCEKCKRDLQSFIHSQEEYFKKENVFNKMEKILNECKDEIFTLISFPQRKETEITKQQAQSLIKDQVAFILEKEPKVLYMRYTVNEISNLALQRDKKRCVHCGKHTNFVDIIQTETQGGLFTLSNLQSICSDYLCNQIYKNSLFSKNKKVSFAIPIYTDNNEFSNVLENPQKNTRKYVFDNEQLHCFCDISEYITETGPTGIYGAVAIVAGMNDHIKVFQAIIHSDPGNSVLAELKNVDQTIEILRNKYVGLKQPVLYTDVDLNSLSKSQRTDSLTVGYWNKIRNKIERIKVENIPPKEQPNQELYQMAHLYSRETVRQYARQQLSVHD